MLNRRQTIRLLAIALLIVLLGVGEGVRVNAALASIIVYDHGFSKDLTIAQRNGNVIPIEKTSNFTQNDRAVYAYLVAAFYAVNFTWQWYNPDGQLYFNQTEQAQCTSTPCTVTSNIYIGPNSGANTMLGSWKLIVLANGNPLYSDSFSLSAVLNENDNWTFRILQSAPPRVHGYLTVTIHPSNQSWSAYRLFMPYAANVTAYESFTNSSLHVATRNDTSQNSYYFVDFGQPRSDGYAFVLSFDLKSGLHDLSGWYGGQFALTWDEYPYERFSSNAVPETFSIALPKGAKLIDVVGIGVVPLKNTVMEQTSVSFNSTFANRPVEWTVIYQDFTYRNAHTNNSTQGPGFVQAAQIMIPFLPLTLGNLNLWTAVMAVFLLTTSELIARPYGRASFGLLLDRKRLRLAALLLVALFLVTTGYQLYTASLSH